MRERENEIVREKMKKGERPYLGMTASAIKTKSILQASMGTCVSVQMTSGAWSGLPLVTSRSTSNCKADSHRSGSPTITMASTSGNSFSV